MSTLVFCTGGGQQSGIGHVMRCQALAQAAEEQGLDSVFIVNPAARQFILQRHDWTGRVELAVEGENALIEQLLNTADSAEAALIVLDGYGFSEAFIRAISVANAPLLLLDDIRQPGYQYADIICNPAGEPWRDAYAQANPGALLCLGAGFRLLRREFVATNPLPLAQRFSLTVNLGGSDPTGLTLPLLKALCHELPEAPFRVVTGPGFDGASLSALADFIATSECAIQHIHNCQDMADLWVNSRLAVAAAGGSQFELAACHTPSVLLVVAENQRQASNQAASQGWCEVFEATDVVALNALAARVKALWHDDKQLNTMYESAAPVAVRDGAWQLMAAIATWRNRTMETSC
ncbi:UDP-2,4-diacetamido-2,4,6-trideoxy-beta-L-altropyranose hydrolase [Alteromonas lipolytica]|uniref:UDP-2,4-diacetamido-2,4, 6-trideoxy-beta-L-altropyranose hydrolase n=1 Tax=Alteromonas lipolytica TaxID=1856405 RepID=A0A1E8FF93_9ALTE|nr:UDP-2,4-diacetamido-2,4,6-trideoxy-beta-L-altropyranose hydrolase [Alteromonas lipolytica]OFI34580.1 UDP-2,4-diacetamido-2,4,6-trideoxy-beta-L-altropyranose hydrolase [Alteromonas lipolytica]GGF52240.1 hypothetical protein GCM10011338_00440 [Alteromonas lipolytica]